MPPRSNIRPNIDPKVINSSNIHVLKKYDSAVQQVLLATSLVSVYELHDGKKWEKQNVEGTLFIVKRKKNPQFQLWILNQKSTENYYQTLSPSCQVQIHEKFLFIQFPNATQGFWFHEDGDLEATATKVRRILNKTEDSSGSTPNAPRAERAGSDPIPIPSAGDAQNGSLGLQQGVTQSIDVATLLAKAPISGPSPDAAPPPSSNLSTSPGAEILASIMGQNGTPPSSQGNPIPLQALFQGEMNLPPHPAPLGVSPPMPANDLQALLPNVNVTSGKPPKPPVTSAGLPPSTSDGNLLASLLPGTSPPLGDGIHRSSSAPPAPSATILTPQMLLKTAPPHEPHSNHGSTSDARTLELRHAVRAGMTALVQDDNFIDMIAQALAKHMTT